MKPERKILIIDQNTKARASFRNHLQKSERFDFRFLEAANGASGIEISQKENPDCILLTENLPDTSAIEMLEKLRTVLFGSIFSTILLLDEDDETLAENAMKSGAQNVHFRGCENGFELRQKVENEIEKHALRREIENKDVIIFKNIAERKNVEQERGRLFEMEKNARRIAEENNRAKDDFLAMLSHELRTPLNAIYGWTQILQNGDFDSEKVEEAIEVIDRNVRLQSALIEDLLDVSRIVSNKMKLEPSIVPLKLTVQKAVDAIRRAAEEKSLAINLKIETDADEVLGDKNRLRQIIDNLLANAVKFTPEGGGLNVSLERSGDKLNFSVEDNGIGINPELLPHIFDRFSQGGSGSKRKYGGLGLGLAIVKHLVGLHYGNVSAHSDGDGKGARFTVEFPLALNLVRKRETPETAEIQSLQQNKSFAGKRILLVDDDRDVLNFLSLVIREEGAEVACCSLASEALEKIKSKNFDLLISDLGMSPMDGFDLIREVRAAQDEYFQTLPAIALTGYVSAQDRELALAAGFHDHIAKPVKLDNLLATIAALLEK